MKKGILIAIFSLILLSGFIGCNHGSRHVEILSSDTLIDVLADLHIAQSAIHVNMIGNGDQIANRRDAYFQWVMRKHHITYQQFDTSYKYYITETERFSKMYDQVINKIKLKELENKRTPKEELVRKDSIRKDSIQKDIVRKATMKKDSIRMDSINKVAKKQMAIQRAQAVKDSIKLATQKKAEYKKENIINETLKKTLTKSDTTKKDTVKKKKPIPVKKEQQFVK